MQDVTDTPFRPALIVELDHLHPGLVRLRMTVIGAQRQFPLHGLGTVLPELFDGLVVQAVAHFAKK